MEVSLGEIHLIVVNGNFTTDFLGIIFDFFVEMLYCV